MDSLLQWLEVPLDSWLACAAVLLLGAFVQRATGFGLAVVGAPLLLMIEPRLVPVILVLFGFTVSLIMVRRYWHEVRLREIGVALIGRLPGNGLGIWLLLAAPMVVLEKLIAAIVLFAVLVTVCRFELPVNRFTLFVAGILSGVFGTVAAIGGPPIVLLMHGFSPDRMRGNLAAFCPHLFVNPANAGAGRTDQCLALQAGAYFSACRVVRQCAGRCHCRSVG
ncbi:hypothetical protein HAALTHF_44690n [Vreelandella aquamarina]|nr:hypothetical protein HAALTHF_44690n [Halomonas axialensis]